MTDLPQDDLQLPPPPERPDCCNGGCAVCVLEGYPEELEAWERTVAALREAHRKRLAGQDS